MTKRLELEDRELEYLGNVLGQRPYVECSALIGKISMQVNDQVLQGEIAKLKEALTASLPPAPPV
jgi:hypothetical protein